MKKLWLLLIIFLVLLVVLSFTFSLISCTGQVVVESIDPPLLSSPIYSSAEVGRLKSLYYAPVVSDGSHHRGIDIVFSDGARVRATAPGSVTQISENVLAYGPIKGVTVKYNDKYAVYYVFEKDKIINVSVGDQVREGDIIGTLGATDKGGTMEAWLHFEVQAYGEDQCPIMFFNNATRTQFETLYNLYPTAGLVDPCYLHPSGCPSLH